MDKAGPCSTITNEMKRVLAPPVTEAEITDLMERIRRLHEEVLRRGLVMHVEPEEGEE